MLINLRNALMAGKRLPYDAEVEYLECAGTSSVFPYIDTGIVGASDVTFAASVYRSTNTTNECAIGAYGSSLRYWASYFFSNTYYLGMGSKTNNTTNAPTETWMLQELKAENGNFNLYSNGSLAATCETSTFDTNQNIYIGCMNYNGGASFYFRGRFGFVRIYSNGVLVRDYIPVRKGTVGYLYDRVSGALFGNAGSGDFVLGPDVVPVEWLEGGQLDSGIAFIDTGYAPNSSTKIESTSAILSTRGYSGRFGDRSRFIFGGFAGSLYLAQGDHYYLGGFTTGTFYSFVNDIPNRTVSVEGVGSTSTTAVSDWYPQLYPVYLFASNVDPITGTAVNGKKLDTNSLGRIRMKSCNIWENDILVHKYLPFRVGTDATSWQGAMMDVLTRRIYRNAGTGAFTYGNDLKYPIPAE